MEAAKTPKIIHIAKIRSKNGKNHFLLLREQNSHNYVWYELSHLNDKSESETDVTGTNIEEAMRLANRHWKQEGFTTLNCGFRYSLPERDEHGINALFYQMAASYNSSNGVYFDDEVGYNCFVNFASLEARNVWQELKQQGRL